MIGQISRGAHSMVATEEEASAKYLTFRLGEDVYGVEVMEVKKIIEYGHLTRVPMMPTFIKGILNLLGEVVPVVDLAICFGSTPEPVTKRTCIVIVEITQGERKLDMGIIVDAVNNVIELPRKKISPAPEFGNDIRTNFIRGVGKVEEGFIMLLNMNHILSAEDLSSMHRVRNQARQMEENRQETASTDSRKETP